MARSDDNDPKLSEVKAVLQRLQGFDTEPDGPAAQKPAGAAHRAGRGVAAVTGVILMATAAALFGAAYLFVRAKPPSRETPATKEETTAQTAGVPQSLPAAQDALLRLLAAEPRHELALVNLAATLAHAGRFDDAIWELDKVLERDPTHPIAGLETARYRWFLGDSAGCAAALLLSTDRLQADDERLGTALELLGEASVRSSSLAKAADALGRGLARLKAESPSRVRVALRFGQACFAAKTPDRAIVPLESVLASVAKDDAAREPLLRLLAELARAAGDPARAESYLEALKPR